MTMVAICQEFGWDYFVYQKQPRWFLDLIQDKLDLDSEEMRKASKRAKRKGR